MKIGPHTVAAIDYRIELEDGSLVSSSEERGPLRFVFGRGEILPGLERRLEGMEPGQEQAFLIPPEEGFGEASPEAIRTLPLQAFPPGLELRPGLILYFRDETGESHPFTVLGVEGERVTVDFNHPLAGKTLRITVAVREVREATEEEMACGISS